MPLTTIHILYKKTCFSFPIGVMFFMYHRFKYREPGVTTTVTFWLATNDF